MLHDARTSFKWCLIISYLLNNSIVRRIAWLISPINRDLNYYRSISFYRWKLYLLIWSKINYSLSKVTSIRFALITIDFDVYSKNRNL